MSMVESLRLVISGNSSGAVQSLKQLEAAAGGTSATMGKTMGGMNKAANIGMGVFVGLAAAVGVSVHSYAAFAIQVAKTSAQTHMGAEATSRFIGQLQMLHVNTASAGMAMKTMESGIYGLQTGTSKSVAAFKILGLTWQDLKNLKPEDQIGLIRDRMSKLTDAGARQTVSTALLGRGAKDMVLWYSASGKAIDGVNAALERNGEILSEKQLKDATAAAAAWQDLAGAFKGVEYAIAQGALPALTDASKVLAAALNVVRPFSKELGWLTIGVGAFVAIVKTAVFFQKTWGQAVGLFAGKEALETASIEANTAAVVENTVAKEANNMVGGGKMGTAWGGVNPVQSLGTAGVGPAVYGGGLGYGLAGAGIGAAIGFAVAPPIERAIAKAMSTPASTRAVQNRLDAGLTYGGAGRTMTMVAPAGSKGTATLMSNYANDKASLEGIAKAVNGLKPSASTVGIMADFIKRLDKLSKSTSPAVADAAKKLEGSLKSQAAAFEQASKAALDEQKALDQTYKTMKDFNAATMAGVSTTAAQAAFASASDQTAAFLKLTQKQITRMYNDNLRSLGMAVGVSSHSQYFRSGQVGMKVPGYAAGVDMEVSHPTLFVAGEGRKAERVKVGPAGAGGDGKVVFQNCTFSAHSPRELVETIKTQLMSEVHYG